MSGPNGIAYAMGPVPNPPPMIDGRIAGTCLVLAVVAIVLVWKLLVRRRDR